MPPALNQILLAALEDTKGSDIRTLDVRGLTMEFDHMIIATGTSRRQVAALAERCMEQARAAGHRPLSTEGWEAGDWVLLDFGVTTVHLMQPTARAFYDLERLWTPPQTAADPAAAPP